MYCKGADNIIKERLKESYKQTGKKLNHNNELHVLHLFTNLLLSLLTFELDEDSALIVATDLLTSDVL